MSVREVAEHLGVGLNTVHDIVARNDLPHLRIGKSIRIPTENLAACIAARTEGTPR